MTATSLCATCTCRRDTNHTLRSIYHIRYYLFLNSPLEFQLDRLDRAPFLYTKSSSTKVGTPATSTRHETRNFTHDGRGRYRDGWRAPCRVQPWRSPNAALEPLPTCTSRHSCSLRSRVQLSFQLSGQHLVQHSRTDTPRLAQASPLGLRPAPARSSSHGRTFLKMQGNAHISQPVLLPHLYVADFHLCTHRRQLPPTRERKSQPS